MSQPNQVKSSQNFQGNFLWVSHYDWNKKTNKSINKQTNKQINKNFQSNFLILNISANSSQIFTKCSGELSVGVRQGLKQKTNKSINKQTNKQTNKHFRTYIFQPNQVRSSWNFEGIWWGPFGYQMGARRAPSWWLKATSPPQELEVWPQ